MKKYILSRKYTKARKPHKCSWCGSDIKVNSKYMVYVVDNGRVHRLRECSVCYAICTIKKKDRFAILDGKRDEPTN
jgi:hypothetical protein